MKRFFLVSLFLIVVFSGNLKAQTNINLSLDEVIKLAEDQSLNAILAKHRFRASYWQFRTFKAEYLPSLMLSGTIPNYSRIRISVYHRCSTWFTAW